MVLDREDDKATRVFSEEWLILHAGGRHLSFLSGRERNGWASYKANHMKSPFLQAKRVPLSASPCGSGSEWQVTHVDLTRKAPGGCHGGTGL